MGVIISPVPPAQGNGSDVHNLWGLGLRYQAGRRLLAVGQMWEKEKLPEEGLP